VLLAIHYAHENDVLHRDLKPSNILVRAADAQPIVVDFGSAYLLEQMDSKSLTTAAVGSVGYIPSEVLADPSKRSTQHDIYSCGVIAYELFARHRPDPSAYRPLSASFAELGALDEAIQKALAPEHSRYASAEDFRLGIVEVERGL
jgi:serine/threonine protein kinase